jgi:hypothetical protein
VYCPIVQRGTKQEHAPEYFKVFAGIEIADKELVFVNDQANDRVLVVFDGCVLGRTT